MLPDRSFSPPPQELDRVQRRLRSLLWIALVLAPVIGAGLLVWVGWPFQEGNSPILLYLAFACFLLSGPGYLLGKWLATGRLEKEEVQGCAELMMGGLEGCASLFVLLAFGILATLLLLFYL
ncbi:MAG TPA: hypothetical protein VFU69_05000 [Ktedonobacterales bacterium]|nr:hypothetical protein [Ktedonobacterales bacterium]